MRVSGEVIAIGESTVIQQPWSWLSKRLGLVRVLLPRMPLSIGLAAITLLMWVWLLLSVRVNSELNFEPLVHLVQLPIIAATSFWTWRVAGGQPTQRMRDTWRLFALGHLTGLLAQLVAGVFEIAGVVSNVADIALAVLQIVFYAFLALALRQYPTRIQNPADRKKFLLDAGILVVSCVTVFGQFVLEPTLVTNRVGQAWPQLLYSVFDLLLVIGILGILIRRENVYQLLPLQLLASGLLLNTLTHFLSARALLIGQQEHHLLIDMLQVAVYLPVFACAELEYVRISNTFKLSADLAHARGFSILPYAGILVSMLILLRIAFVSGNTLLIILMLGVVVLIGLVVWRHFITMRENIELSALKITQSNEARFQSLVQSASDIIMILDEALSIRFISPSVTRTLGYEPDQLIGQPYPHFLAPDERNAVEDLLRNAFKQPNANEPISATWRLRSARGHLLYSESNITNLLDDPNINGLVLNTRDLTEREELESQLTHLAYHDSLTNLANRAMFQRRLETTLSRVQQRPSQIAVLFLDLDNFKEVNDTLGHDQGNAVLIIIAERLSRSLGDYNLTARLGGDEFAALLENVTSIEEAMSIAQRLLHQIHIPIFIDDQEILITASIGISLSNVGDTAADLLRNADMAMYVAKFDGGNRMALFEPEMRLQMVKRRAMQEDLRRAISSTEFALEYQPIVSLDTHEIVGAEALLRWAHPDHGVLPPGDFIPLAEENGMIVPIGRWVMQHAFMAAAQWQQRAGAAKAPFLSINISSRQLRESHFVRDVQAAIEGAQLNPQSLMFEITESVLIENTELALETLSQLRKLGVRLGIDDFGTGYSSLGYLQRIPVDMIKIARSFVERIDEGADNYALAQAIFSLGKSLRLMVIAEGIETVQQLRLLRELGCNLAQGYYFAQPMTMEALQQLIANNRAAGQIAFPGLARP